MLKFKIRVLQVTLSVTFGTRDNYRTESIIFEVA